MGFSGWTCSEEGQGEFIRKLGDDNSFLGCTWRNPHRLPSKGKTINREYYSNLFERFGPHNVMKKVLFYQDNAPLHTRALSMTKLYELFCELVPHPPYFPHLATCDYFLFPNLIKWLGGKKLSSNDFLKWIQKLEKHWSNCTDLLIQPHIYGIYSAKFRLNYLTIIPSFVIVLRIWR